MHKRLFDEFLKSGDSLRVYEGDKLVFSSDKDRLTPLIEYVDGLASQHRGVVVFDKIMGNAAALLSVKADCREVYSPLGSQPAISTLDRYGIEHHIIRVVPYIQKPGGEEMCPMEKLSLNKGPEEFYEAIKRIINNR